MYTVNIKACSGSGERFYVVADKKRIKCENGKFIFSTNEVPVHIEIYQKSVLRSWYWWLTMLNPLYFFSFALWKDRLIYLRAFDSLSASLEFDVLPDFKENGDSTSIDLELYLKYKSSKCDGFNHYFMFEMNTSSSSRIKNVIFNRPSKKVKNRWRLNRLLPMLFTGIAIWIFGIWKYADIWSVAIPAMYMIISFIHSMSVINVKSVNEQLGTNVAF